MAKTISLESMSALRRSAVDVHRAFAGLSPVIQRTRLVSLNALISSARAGAYGESFGIIAKELNLIGSELTRLIHEMEGLFREGVDNVAKSVRAEQQWRLLMRSLERVRGAKGASRSTVAVKGGRPALSPTAAAFCEHVAKAIAASQEELAAGLNDLAMLSRGLSKRIDRINWVAVRQSHITAVAARIEAARSQVAGSGLADVAAIIRELADEISGAESSAKERVDGLTALSNAAMGASLAQDAAEQRSVA